MRSASQLGRLGAVLVLGLAACEVLIMISPFAGFFYGGVRFEPFLGFLSESRASAWLNGQRPVGVTSVLILAPDVQSKHPNLPGKRDCSLL